MKISIACCTYNGEKYLKEQLDSIENQTLKPYEVVIVDDASLDETFAILEAFQKTSSLKVRLFKNSKNLGVVKSFEKAISLCEGDYISLCDQDDVWLPEKLEIFSKKMKESEEKYGPDLPLLIYSDLKIVDKDLKLISPSMFKYQSTFQVEGNPFNLILIQNLVTGCASMFNKSLKEIALPIGKNALVHDWWFALVASNKGKIVPIKEATLLYRQHGKNDIGAKKLLTTKNIIKGLKFLKLNQVFSRQILQARDLETKNFESTLQILDKGGFASIKLSIKENIFPQTLIRKLKFILILFFRPFLKLP